jgi:hypothetical protein
MTMAKLSHFARCGSFRSDCLGRHFAGSSDRPISTGGGLPMLDLIQDLETKRSLTLRACALKLATETTRREKRDAYQHLGR